MEQLPAVNAEVLEEDNDTQIKMGKCRVFDNNNDEQYRAFRLIYETLEVNHNSQFYKNNQHYYRNKFAKSQII